MTTVLRGILGAGVDLGAPAEPRAGRALRDPLLAVSPDACVRALLGITVRRHRKISCPFREDRHSSLQVYPRPADGWYCDS